MRSREKIKLMSVDELLGAFGTEGSLEISVSNIKAFDNHPFKVTDDERMQEFISIDELAVMDGSKCIVQVRGVRPFFSDKYDLTQHPQYPLTADADKRNWFDIEKFLNHKLILKPDDEYEVIEMNED